MSGCPTYVADPGFQITQGGKTGPYDCTAHSASDAIDHATCGKRDPSGRTIRLLSNEPIPSPTSPGLNLTQVATVAREDFGVYLEVRTGSRKVLWAEYERRRLAGQGVIVQLNYGPIADSKYDAGRGFRGGHAMFETLHSTYDPLADGRAPGVFRHDGSVYDRELIKRAAGALILRSDPVTGKVLERVGYGSVWCAFTRDVVPDYTARVPSGDFWAYHVDSGVVRYRRTRKTGGFSGPCTAPRSYLWPSERRTVTLVRMLSGAHAGRYISANWSRETT
jgi:hypothetical protein